MTVVYIGYPCESHNTPSWADDLISKLKDSCCFYLSGGQIVPSTLSQLSTHVVSASRVERLSSMFSGRYLSRLLPTLLEATGEKISSYTLQNPVNIESLVLQDLWVMLRSDYFVADLDLLGRGRVGMELTYASVLGLKTVGVTQCVVADPWSCYHVDKTCKPGRVSEEIT